MENEKLLVDREAVNELWGEYRKWQKYKDANSWDEGYKCGIRHALTVLRLKEAKS